MESFLRSRRGGECEKGAPLPLIYDSGEHQSFFRDRIAPFFIPILSLWVAPCGDGAPSKRRPPNKRCSKDVFRLMEKKGGRGGKAGSLGKRESRGKSEIRGRTLLPVPYFSKQ